MPLARRGRGLSERHLTVPRHLPISQLRLQSSCPRQSTVGTKSIGLCVSRGVEVGWKRRMHGCAFRPRACAKSTPILYQRRNLLSLEPRSINQPAPLPIYLGDGRIAQSSGRAIADLPADQVRIGLVVRREGEINSE